MILVFGVVVRLCVVGAAVRWRLPIGCDAVAVGDKLVFVVAVERRRLVDRGCIATGNFVVVVVVVVTAVKVGGAIAVDDGFVLADAAIAMPVRAATSSSS